VKSLASNKPVVLAVKINDGAITKLKATAHPKLGELLKDIQLARVTKQSPFLVGPAGCGKTMLAEQAAEALGLPFDHICFSAGASETWLFGRQTPNGFIEAGFSRLYEHGGVFLADEIDAADPNLLMALNTALAGDLCTNPISGKQMKRHPNFIFIGAANTFGKGGNAVYTGRNRLDAATLDRFSPIEVEYLPDVERQICANEEIRNKLQDLRKQLKERGASEVISYRKFQWANAAIESGAYDFAEALRKITLSWPTALKKELGIL
jgi:MoxR-like ATPase